MLTSGFISKKFCDDDKSSVYTNRDSSTKILDEVKKVLVTEKNNSYDCISLYDVANLLKMINNNYKKTKNCYKEYFNKIIKEKFGIYSHILIYDFDYDNKELKIKFNRGIDNIYEEICFRKKDGILYIINSYPSNFYSKEIFKLLEYSLSNLYDEFITLSYYRDKKNNKYDIKSINSIFKVNINNLGVEVFDYSIDSSLIKDFKLVSHSDDNDYSLFYKSAVINEIFRGIEEDLFKSIFVKISDCPTWSQSILSEIRFNQLSSERKNHRKLK